jgi:hypothetical protein
MKCFKVPAPGEAAEPVRTPAELARMAAVHRARETVERRKDAARRRWALLNGFIDSGMAGLKPSDVVVWFALFRHARADGAVTVARSRLLKMTGLAPRTVTVCIRRMIDAGWIERIRRGDPSGGIAIYRVTRPGEVG